MDLVKFTIDFANFYALYLAISLTLNLEFGYTGIPNFGKVLFIAGGAAVSGSISGRVAALVYKINTQGDFITFNAQVITQANTLLGSDARFAVELTLFSLLLAALVGAAFGYLSSYPAIKLREDYLGVLLLAVAQFFQVFLRGFDQLVGGTQGIFVPDPYFSWTGAGIGVRDLVATVVISAFAIAVYVYLARVARSPLGRTLKAVRDNEDASRALGKDDISIRRKVLIIASAISGVAGALITFYAGSVGAETWSRFAWTFWPWLIVIIGGSGSNVGVALGALFFTLLTKGLEQVKFAFQPYVPFDVNWLQYLLFASLLIVVLLVRPEGIIREKPAMTIRRSWVRARIGGESADRQGEGTKLEPLGTGSRAGRMIRRIQQKLRFRSKMTRNQDGAP